MLALSSLRHWGVRSTAYDLGFYDQAVYLISRGLPPITLSGYHVLGDHAQPMLYFPAVFYWIYADVHWLLALQAACFAGAGILVWILADRAGLPSRTSTAVVLAYLFYPMVFQINLLDFHPDVFMLPALFGAILAARSGRMLWFVFCLAVVLMSKEQFSLPVAAMGVWLLLFESRHHDAALRTRIRIMGAAAIVLGVAWLYVSTQVIIPAYGGPDMTRGRYAYLGGSFEEAAMNLLRNPGLATQHLFTRDNLQMMILLLVPVGWALSPRHLAPLMGAVPTVLVNLMSTAVIQKSHWYSLAAVPFLFVAGISSLGAARAWRKHPALIVTWALVAFVWFADADGVFRTVFRPDREAVRPRVKAAVSLITTDGGVMTTNDIGPYVTHRKLVKLAIRTQDTNDLSQIDYVLLSVRHPGLFSTPGFAAHLVKKMQDDPAFIETYSSDDIHLFTRKTVRETK